MEFADTLALGLTVLLAAAGCDEPPGPSEEGPSVESQVDALRKRIETFEDENAEVIRRHRPDAALELAGPDAE